MSPENVNRPFPRRTELHGSSSSTGSSVVLGVSTDSSKGSHRSSHFDAYRVGGFVAVTGLMAVGLSGPATTGVALADSRSDSSTKTEVVPTSTEDSWADLTSDALQDTGEFAASASAASRARLRTPLVADSCLQLLTAANGSRSVTEAMRVYYPLREGTYSTSSPYGYRFSPITGAYELHTGDDYAAPFGTPIHAIADGTVTFAEFKAGYGYLTIIEHVDTDGSKVESWYLHQAEGTQIALAGTEVKAGDQIGSVGSTGNSTGPHLHLEIHLDGSSEAISPGPWLEAHDAVFLGQECS